MFTALPLRLEETVILQCFTCFIEDRAELYGDMRSSNSETSNTHRKLAYCEFCRDIIRLRKFSNHWVYSIVSIAFLYDNVGDV
jgi:hypothetical protein